MNLFYLKTALKIIAVFDGTILLKRREAKICFADALIGRNKGANSFIKQYLKLDLILIRKLWEQ